MDRKRQKSREVDIKSGEVLAKSEKPKSLPKTHKDYWKEKMPMALQSISLVAVSGRLKSIR
jgi:ABC-type phosphate/phosphonate transport system ATPase subunit